MLGAILGDMIGAPYEFDRGKKTKVFPLFGRGTEFTDDSVMTVAVAEALMDTLGQDDGAVRAALIRSMRDWGRRYPYAGYGGRFYGWLHSDDPQPYGSYGNGSAMRVAAAGWLYDTMEETRHAARLTAGVTHNHPEGIKGAESVASAIYLARNGSGKNEIRDYITREFGYDLSRTCDQIRPAYHHVESCQETVPEAITAFLEGSSFEDVIRTAVSLGGDCDTLTCIAGSMAEAFYGVPAALADEGMERLDEDLQAVVRRFYSVLRERANKKAPEREPSAEAQAGRGHYRHFTLTTYFVAHAAATVTKEELDRQLDFMLKHLRLDKVYLEPWRGELASHEQIELCRRAFEARGIKVAGGLTTVIPTPEGERPKQRLFNTFCYNDPKMRAKLREVSAFTAAHFDEFIIDDFFFTNCMCVDCVREKNAYNAAHGITDGSWQAYRLDLMRRVSEEDVIAPAKAANPDCKITIKYPNWAESYQETGYNPAAQRELFDRIYTGTETRDPVSTDQHLPRYLSYSLMTYFENMWPGHNGGGWFDTFDTHVTEHYLEQAYLTAFSRPQELMLFCFQSLVDNMYTPALGFQLDKLDALLDHAGQPTGIACYLPDNCQGEDNVQDFLGMCGLPIVCTPYFPEDAERILLTRSSACDANVVEKLEKWLARTGGDAIVTTGFVDAAQGRGLERLTSVRLRGRQVTADRYRIEEGLHARYHFPRGVRPVTLPVAEFRNNATWAVVKAAHDEESYGILLRDDYMDGHLWTLAVPDACPDLYALPAEVLSRIRQIFAVNGVWLEGPARISVFMYDNDSFVVYPYVMDGVQRETVRLHVRGAKLLRSTGRPKELQPLYVRDGEAVFEVDAWPGRYVLYEIIR